MTFKTVYQIGHLMSMGFLMELKKAAGKPAALKFGNYIIPIPPPAGAAAGTGSLILATHASVVRNVDATLVAFCRAVLVTLAGSRIPASTMLTYCSL